MKIGIVGGTGDIGEGIAMRLSPNHNVVIGSREEEKRKDEFYGSVSSAIERSLVSKSASIIGKKANHINDMSSIVYPIFAGKSFFEMLKKTSMDEGDLMRLFSQLTDRLQQLIRAADDYELRQRLESCLGTIKGFIKDIY